MMRHHMRAIGIPWYRGEDYLLLRALMVDAESLPPVYDDWLLVAEELEEQLVRAGHTVERVFIDHDEFKAWCRVQNCGWDADARSRYVQEIAHRRNRN
jgi:hypothetical protein